MLTLMGFNECQPRTEVTRVVTSPGGDLYLEVDTQPIPAGEEEYWQALLEDADGVEADRPRAMEAREAEERAMALAQVHSPQGREGPDETT